MSLPLLLALGGYLVMQQADPVPDELEGRILGVCLRWGEDRSRVEEAVVVVPSRNEALDRGMPESIRRIEWRNDGEGREWIGIWLAVGSNVSAEDMSARFPDCSQLPSPQPRPENDKA